MMFNVALRVRRGGPRCVVGDVRNKSEARFLESMRGIGVRIERDRAMRLPSIERRTGGFDMEMEMDLDDYPFSHVIMNDGSKESLFEKVAIALY